MLGVAVLALCIGTADCGDGGLSAAGSGSIPEGRVLQDISGSAPAATPTLDDPDNVIFSRPPYSSQKVNLVVYYIIAGLYFVLVILLLVAVNLDQAERKERRARAIVPEESTPCTIAEHYYLAEFKTLQLQQDWDLKKQRMTFCSYLKKNLKFFPERLTRQHLLVSFLVHPIPTFIRLKRWLVIVTHIHVCMLAGAFAYNIIEHDKDNGTFEMIACSGSIGTDTCSATLPLAVITAAATYPFIRFCVYWQLRQTCCSSQFHPSRSEFPLNVRKFAFIPPKSAWETFLCMHTPHERRQAHIIQGRSFVHRLVYTLWRTTLPSIQGYQFYSLTTSWLIVFLNIAFNLFTFFYLVLVTAYLKDEVVYHWLAWTAIMFFSAVFVLEPLTIFWTQVIWATLTASLAQWKGLGSHAMARATDRHKPVVQKVNDAFVDKVRGVAATRIQHWWAAVLDMSKAMNDQEEAATRIQAIWKKMQQQKVYNQDKKWCLWVEVLECSNLAEIELEGLMSPFVRLQCDVGNPNVTQTEVAQEAHTKARYKQSFFFDIRESSALYVSVWSKSLTEEIFIGRGYFTFDELRSKKEDADGGHLVKVPLYSIQHGEARPKSSKSMGVATCRVHFLDPSKDARAQRSDTWMLPKSRMKVALSKMGGRLKVGKMLGGMSLPAGSASVASLDEQSPMLNAPGTSGPH